MNSDDTFFYRHEGFAGADLSDDDLFSFRDCVYSYYSSHKRDLPWRNTSDPYKILISEVMLQQTQVPRVIDKFHEFIAMFPDIETLAHSSFDVVLSVWKGLGYNRRAKMLHAAAQNVVEWWKGSLPDDEKELVKLPGIGSYTAAAVCAFAFNKPTTVIETNIRTVFIHCFLHGRDAVSDKEIIPLIEKTCDREHPRDWYNALMDYGTMIKMRHPNPSRKSSHYVKQGKFEGSNRQIRSFIIELLMSSPLEQKALCDAIARPSALVADTIARLVKEGIVIENNGVYRIFS